MNAIMHPTPRRVNFPAFSLLVKRILGFTAGSVNNTNRLMETHQTQKTKTCDYCEQSKPLGEFYFKFFEINTDLKETCAVCQQIDLWRWHQTDDGREYLRLKHQADDSYEAMLVAKYELTLTSDGQKFLRIFSQKNRDDDDTEEGFFYVLESSVARKFMETKDRAVADQETAQRALYKFRKPLADLKKARIDRAHQAVGNAVAKGDLVRPELCSACGLPGGGGRIEGHHEDYSKPLDVTWLCPSCHKKLHLAQKRETAKAR